MLKKKSNLLKAKTLVLNFINVRKEGDCRSLLYLCEAALYDGTLLLCSVRPLLSLLLIQSSNQCLIISFIGRTRIAYSCTDNGFVCPSVKFSLLGITFGKIYPTHYFTGVSHPQNSFLCQDC